ncbi:FecR family protein [Pedobacter hartonius]|uniref:FecR family protein n=1 Tax=Pedobacter hartonius TaxID=425514 RepID=A0A1H4BTF7_9SPHI|nr:FecR family protein [Pedobacter hartonius]SEA51393.1 FecR family protein [Pedobacter hartonius]
MSPDQIEALLVRYLEGQTTTEENQLVERWLEQNNNANAVWPGMDQPAKDKWLSGVFDEISNTIPKGSAKVLPLPGKKRLLWQRIASIAAALLISFALYLEWQPIKMHFQPVQFNTLHVPPKHKKQVHLADGSQVWINEGSELKYPEIFEGRTREVYLSGEAYFDIAHNAAKPFIIHTGKVVTTVLGTAFNIREDQNNHTVVVTVTRGKVSVADEHKLLGIIIPDQQISFNTSKNEVVKAVVDAQQVIAWQHSDLHFEDVSFAEAALKLQQRFNVKISFSNEKLKNCRFTGTSLNGEKLEKILKVICAFNNASYQTRPDGSILIGGKGCK